MDDCKTLNLDFDSETLLATPEWMVFLETLYQKYGVDNDTIKESPEKMMLEVGKDG